MNKIINIALAVIFTLFVAFVTGGLLAAAVHFGFSTVIVAMLSGCFLVVTIGVGTVSIMEAMDLV